MVIRNYILTTLRLMINRWWLSLIKIFSLTTGIVSFLLVWLFYVDSQFLTSEKELTRTCTLDNAAILSFILIVTTLIYFLVMRSQITFRQKELFFRKFYGETNKGIFIILMIETSIFILISFVLSLVLIDQIAPLFNLITSKNINLQQASNPVAYLMILCFLILLGFVIGILPSVWYTRNRAVDILKKLPRK